MTTLVSGVTTPPSPGATRPPSPVDAAATNQASSPAPFDPIAAPLAAAPVVPLSAGVPDEPDGGDSELPDSADAPLSPTGRPLPPTSVVPLAAPEPLPLVSVAGAPLVPPDPPALGKLLVEVPSHAASRTAAKLSGQMACDRTFIAKSPDVL